jgi:thiamine-phosphate diphosphorylase
VTAVPGRAVAVPVLLVVTDRSIVPLPALVQLWERVLDRVPPGSAGLYLREPGLDDRALLGTLERVVGVARSGGRRAVVLVRGRPDLAAAGGADGVHLQADGLTPREVREAFPDLCVGYSAHGLEEVARVAPAVDYLTFSPVFASPGKGPPQGLDALAGAVRAAGETPVLALGGVTGPAQARQARRHGARGVAVLRGVLAAADPAAAAAALLEVRETAI